jgi:hypothetical protein
MNSIEKYEEVGIDQGLCFLQFSKWPHHQVMDAIRLISTQIIPACAMSNVVPWWTVACR